LPHRNGDLDVAALCDKIKDDEMGRACGTHVEEKYTRGFW
jgi:hypothetical protein